MSRIARYLAAFVVLDAALIGFPRAQAASHSRASVAIRASRPFKF